MISRREFMAGSDALAASSAPTRLAPGPESIWINDVHSQLNPTRAGNFTATVTGRCVKRGSCRAKIEGNPSSEWAARNFLSTSVRSPSRDFLFANTVTVQTMEAWFCGCLRFARSALRHWGADHYLRPQTDVRQLVLAVLQCLGEELHWRLSRAIPAHPGIASRRESGGR